MLCWSTFSYIRAWMELPLWYLECWLYPSRALFSKYFVLWSFCCMYKLVLKMVAKLALWLGRSIVPNSWELGAPCNDGEGPWTHSTAHVKKSGVSTLSLYDSMFASGTSYWMGRLTVDLLGMLSSRHAEKYVRKGKLDWPEGASSRDSIKAVSKLPRLQVLSCFY